ncbi:MAG: YgfZ/GcvT domain-containing protein [bacterium]
MDTIKNFQLTCGAKFDSGFPNISAFQGFENEYQAATNGRAIFDLTGLNILQATGKDCSDLFHRMTMNEIRKMQSGDIVVNAFSNAKGKLIDVFFQIKLENGYHLITSNGQGKKVAEWLDRYIFIEEVEYEDVTSQFSLFLLTGNNAGEVFGDEFPAFHLKSASLNGNEFELAAIHALLPKGLLLIVPAESALDVYKNLIHENQYIPASATAFHALRIEQGVPIYGNEFTTDDVNPYEAGLKDYVSYTKGCYIGQEVIARLDTYDKVKYEYARLSVSGPSLQNLPAAILADQKEVGVLTSSAQNAQDNSKSLAIGRIRRKALQENQKFHIISGTKSFDVKVISSTFHV